MYKKAVCGFATWQHALTCVVCPQSSILEITDHWIDSKSGIIFAYRRGLFGSFFLFLRPATPRPRLLKSVAWWGWRMTEFRVDYLRNRCPPLEVANRKLVRLANGFIRWPRLS